MRTLKQIVPLLVAFVVLQVLFRFGIPRLWAGVGPSFWTVDNQVGVMDRITIHAILAFGMTLTILIGGIDLSVGAVVALVGTTAVYLVTLGGDAATTTSWFCLAVAGGMGLGLLFGLFHGVAAAKTRMPPFIITLASMLIARGLALRYNNGQPMSIPDGTPFRALGFDKLIHLLPERWSDWLAAAKDHSRIARGAYDFLAAVPITVLIMLAVFGVLAVVLHRTRFGQHLYAIGGNREAARYSGISVARNEIAAYTICGLLAGLAGILHTSRAYSAEPGAGTGFELSAIAAAVIGGTSFNGGVGTMFGTLLGAIIIGLVDCGLNQAQVHHSYQHIIKGMVILAAVFLDVQRRKQ
jgi:ribose transport system permease protein